MKNDNNVIVILLSIIIIILLVQVGVDLWDNEVIIVRNDNSDNIDTCKNGCGCEYNYESSEAVLERVNILDQKGSVSIKIDGIETIVLILETTKVYDKNDKLIEASDLKEGEKVIIEYEGILEMFPQQTSAITVKKSS